MEKLNDLLKKQLEASEKRPQISVGGVNEPAITSEMMINVNKVFTTIHMTYPAWYEKYYPSQKSEQLAKRIWLTGIKFLNSEQVSKGLQRMVMECSFPPKLKEFMQLCKRVEGLVDVDIAWSEALMGRYSHPVIKVAAELTSVFELQQACYENTALKKRFEYYFIQVSDNFSQGKPLASVKEHQKNNINNLLSKVEQQADKRVKERIMQQGIDKQNARETCLALLGIKRH